MLVTLTTDFGTRSPFVASMKGVILSIHPAARIIDLSHEIPPYDLRHVAFFLAEAVPHFPPGTVHVVVVDPEVGTERASLYVEVGGQRLLTPDNGGWARLGEPTCVRHLTEPQFRRAEVSATFHGRDVFAPAAAHLSLGVDPAELGPLASVWRKLLWPTPSATEGEVVFVDHFGNLITNLEGASLPPWSSAQLGGAAARRVRTYGDADEGELVALIGSSGLLEIAEVRGSAARRLAAGVGAAVRIG